jgi:hypothetical protein
MAGQMGKVQQMGGGTPGTGPSISCDPPEVGLPLSASWSGG